MGAGAVLAFFGFIHAGRLGPSGGELELGVGAGLPWAIGYVLTALLFLLLRPGGVPDGAERQETAP